MPQDPFDSIAAQIETALDRQDAERVGDLWRQRHQMMQELQAGDPAASLPRALLEKLAAQNRAWLERGGEILQALKDELDDFGATRQTSIRIGQAYGAASVQGQFVSRNG